MDYTNFEYLRSRPVMPHFTADETDNPYAMIFVVNDAKDREHEDKDVILSVIAATVQVLTSDDVDTRARIESWLSGRIRKLVKRGRGSQFTNIVELAASEVVEPENVLVFAPLRTSEVPASVRKLQLTGLATVPSTKTFPVVPSQLTVTLNSELGMSVAKAAVQAAHAVQVFLMRGAENDVKSFIAAGCPVLLAEGVLVDDGDVNTTYIFDAGFTEIPSGSLTASAVFHP